MSSREIERENKTGQATNQLKIERLNKHNAANIQSRRAPTERVIRGVERTGGRQVSSRVVAGRLH